MLDAAITAICMAFIWRNHGYGSEKLDRLQFLHAVALPEHSYACGQQLAQLQLDDLNIKVKSVRRAEQEFTEVHGDFTLQQDDVVLLAGSPRAIEAGESYLLNG